MIKIKKIWIYVLMTILLISLVSAWEVNSSLVNGVTQDFGREIVPTIFNNANSLIIGDRSGDIFSYSWNGSSWYENNTVKNGIVYDNSVYDTPHPYAFYNDNIWNLLIGKVSNNPILGYSWDGSQWNTNSSLLNGLKKTVSGGEFYTSLEMNGDLILFETNKQSYNLLSYTWNGTGWNNDNLTSSGVVLTNIPTTPSAYYSTNNSRFEIIFGQPNGEYSCYYWTGSTWESNSSICNNLLDEGYSSSPSTFQRNGYINLISGDYDGYLVGYSYLEAEEILYNNNVTLKLNDGSQINNFSVMVDDVSYSTTTGEVVTNISLNSTEIIDLEYYNIQSPEYGYYNNLIIINHIFTNTNYIYTGSISKNYYQIELNVNDSTLNFTVNVGETNYSTTDGNIETGINIDSLKSYNLSYYGFQDGYLFHDTQTREINFTNDLTSYTLNWDSYFKELIFYAYNVNDSVSISSFSVDLDGAKYSTTDGSVNTGIEQNQDLAFDITFKNFDTYNLTHEYKDKLYNNYLFTPSSNTLTGNILIGKFPALIIGNESVNWTNELTYIDGTYTNSVFNNGITLNNQLNGLYCSEIINTGHAQPLYDYMTFDKIYNNIILTDGIDLSNLIHKYNLNDASSEILNSINDDNGFYNGNLNNESGHFNYSIGFDGIDDKITTQIDLSSKSSLSMSIWFYRNSSLNKMMVDETATNGDNIRIIEHSNDNLYIIVSPDLISYPYSGTGWINLGFTFDGGNKLIMYLNGSEVAQKDITNTQTKIFDSNLTLGYTPSGNYYSNGKMDELLIFDEVLNASEMEYIYTSSNPDYYTSETIERNINLSFRTCTGNLCLSEQLVNIVDETPSDLTNFAYNPYFQWCADLSTSNINYPPVLNNVSVFYHSVNYDPTNTNPTIPTDIIFNPLTAYSNLSLMFTASGSTDIDLDTISYYYQVDNITNIIQSWNLNNILNVSDYENQTLNINVKSYDGQNYSNIYLESININEMTEPYIYNPPTYPINGTEVLKFGECPTTDNGLNNMWIILIISISLGLFGIIYKNLIMVLVSGGVMILFSLILMPCGVVMGYISIVFGVIFIFTGLSIKH